MTALVALAQSDDVLAIEGVPGLTLDLLANCGVMPPSEREDIKEWAAASLRTLAMREMSIMTLRGILLGMAAQWHLWHGKSDTFSDYVQEYAGMTKFDASRLSTMARVLISQVGVSSWDIAQIKDMTKAHKIAVRAERMLEQATDDRERDAVYEKVREVVVAAPETRREDIDGLMDDLNISAVESCFDPVWQRVCGRTGEVNPSPSGCHICGTVGQS